MICSIIAYTFGEDNYLGYLYSGEWDGLVYDLKDSPIVIVEGKMIIGVIDCIDLVNYLKVNQPDIPQEVSYSSIKTSLVDVTTNQMYKDEEFIIITVHGEIFYMRSGILYPIQDSFMTIGHKKDISWGCFYGLKDMNIPIKSKIEISLTAVKEATNSRKGNIGIERI
jgi:hypothetical protein